MTKFALLSTALATTLVALLPAAPAQAANNTSFVSSTGVNAAGGCTRAAPCLSIGFAVGETNEGGEIRCLDSGPFSSFGTGAKTITIDCNGGSLNVPGIAVGITADLGTNKVVTVRNMTINGVGIGGSGIFVVGTGTLIVENVKITGVRGSDGLGIAIKPAAGQVSKVFVSDSLIANSGLAASGGGIIVQPAGSGAALVVLNRVQVEGNTFGIAVDGTGSTGGVNMTIADSVTGGNSQDGIIAVTPAGGAPIGVMVKNSKSANNAIGIRAIGAGVTVRVDGSTVIGNGTGLSFLSGGALLSFGNNAVQANGTNGAFSGAVGLQ